MPSLSKLARRIIGLSLRNLACGHIRALRFLRAFTDQSLLCTLRALDSCYLKEPGLGRGVRHSLYVRSERPDPSDKRSYQRLQTEVIHDSMLQFIFRDKYR